MSTSRPSFLGLGLIALLDAVPALRPRLWRWWYDALAQRDHSGDLLLMNFGYDDAHPLHLDPKSIESIGVRVDLIAAGLGAALLLLAPPLCQAQTLAARCGEVLRIATHGNSQTRYALVPPPHAAGVTLVLLAGGSGHIDLDDQGCARALKGNSLVRSIPIFNALGFGTALVDAPSDLQGEDGLGGFRIAVEHAEDLGKIIADLRVRTKGSVWVIGTSRGTISAVNAAARLTGSAAPDGVVLTSALMIGQSGANKSWVAHTVFDLPLEDIRVPLLLIGHAADLCLRSPAGAMDGIVVRVPGVRKQQVTVSGGPGSTGFPSLAGCEGRAPHGFIEQEEEVAAGIARFIRGGNY